MTRILALSSQVSYGHVGLSAAVPVLQTLGHHVTALPTVLLSNHPGWPNVAGAQVPVAQLRAMIDALDDNGWLAAHDTILTGYLPSADHVGLAAELIDRLRDMHPPIRVVVDPVLGDAPKGLYLAVEAAEAIRESLIARADVLTPNRFELAWLTDMPTDDLSQSAAAAQSLGRSTLMTSAPAGPGQTGILHCAEDNVTLYPTDLHAAVPNGVGDVFSALIAAGLSPKAALGHLQSLIAQSLEADHLRIIETALHWTQARPIDAS